MKNIFTLGYGLIFSGLIISLVGYGLIGLCMVGIGFLIHMAIVNIPF